MARISKKNFLENFNIEDNGIISNLYDKIVLSEKTGKTVFCDCFYTPNIWKKLLEIQNYIEAEISLSGIFGEAERRMVVFNKASYVDFPIKLIRIENLSRFTNILHKDYLGSLMGLGIKRDKFGDLICYDNHCIIPVCEDIHQYIIMNLNNAGKAPCRVSVIGTDSLMLSEPHFNEMIVICASMRLDAVVCSLCNCSRSASADLVSRGKILVDYSECCIKDKRLEEGSVITIRGYGKYVIEEEMGFTKNGNLKLKVKKYK